MPERHTIDDLLSLGIDCHFRKTIHKCICYESTMLEFFTTGWMLCYLYNQKFKLFILAYFICVGLDIFNSLKFLDLILYFRLVYEN